ncbi:hypothetical protein [Ramlibacter sp.]|uniref:hypothetical protein n=1 Tax=Ramlibacter sp. TaxID=1917967 RepID=UPI003D1524BD
MSIAATPARRLLWVFLSILSLTLILAAAELASQGFLRAKQQLQTLSQAQGTLPRLAADEVAQATHRVQSLRTAPADALRARIAELDRQLSQHAGQPALRTLPSHQIALLALRGQLLDRIRTEVQVELWRQELSYLEKLAQAGRFRNDADRLAALVRERDAAYADREAKETVYREARSRLGAVERAMGFMLRNPRAQEAEARKQDWYEAILRHRDLHERTEALRKALLQHPGRADPGLFAPSLEAVTSTLRQALDGASAAIEDEIASNWLHRLAQAWSPYLLQATATVASIVALYVAWKALFFFVVAPWVSRRPPIRIETGRGDDTDTQERAISPSAVSQRVALAPGQELLIKDPYLQDSPADARASTRALLSSAYPIACLAAGMFGLTRVKADAAGLTVTVSSTVDPLDELALVSLSRTNGLVLLPRFLVAVVQDVDAPIAIRSVWRLGSLQAWLTFQLRYLVFTGAGAVIVRGCRGVRVERPDAQRRIAQSATIGFDAGLDYANRRTETFLPYLLGMKPLFHDAFAGRGVYAYQEVPASRGAPGRAEGRLMGVLDTLLKPFGI